MTKLSEVREGSTVKIVKVSTDSGVEKVICEIGLAPGRTAKVLVKRRGLLVVSVGGSKFCLGRGIADLILVEEDMELKSYGQSDTSRSNRSS